MEWLTRANNDLEGGKNRRHETGGAGGCESEFDDIKVSNMPRMYKSILPLSHRVAAHANTHASARTRKGDSLTANGGRALLRKCCVFPDSLSTVVWSM